ncbi:GHKL domain-containing protein [Anaerotignum sp.]|uniref:GHKL domain-containing protein n=1 Tax=Anaerotignum sp. TaxID=2039241 RepID=UPI0028AA6F31|nr:GHKL domain-containing protein [Anaerotignum sp.]
MKRQSAITLLTQIIIITVSFCLILGARNFMIPQTSLSKVAYITDVMVSVDGKTGEALSLPYSFTPLQPRTPVTITANITPQTGDVIYIKTVCSPAKIYADDILVYEFGKNDSYPDFMVDPATEVYIANLEIYDREIILKMEFTSPVERTVLTVHPPIMGNTKAVILEVFKIFGVPFMFSAMQLLAGALLLCISVFVMIFGQKGNMFFWLGIFSLSAGTWAFGECPFTGLLIGNPTLLYLLSYIGLFTLPIPLMHFAIASIDFKNPNPIWISSVFMTVLCILACLLQLFKIVPFSKSMHLFHIVVPITLCFLAGTIIYESLRYRNSGARRLGAPIVALALVSLPEVFNCRIKYTYRFALLFQIGILFFIMFTGIAAGLYIRDMVNIRRKQERLTFEMRLLEFQVEEQKKYGFLMADNEERLKQQRHDLRHHLTAIKELSCNENEALQKYLCSLIENIPTAQKNYCENRAVNSVICHYATLCEKQGIIFTTKLTVLQSHEQILDNELCVIFGNLLENAIEACSRVAEGQKYIDLRSCLQYELLTITMDNSFDGNLVVVDGKIRSSKRKDFGIGLSSIQSVAQKHHGDAEFKNNEAVFLSSVYLKA